MLQKTAGIVLHTFKYGDTSIIVHMYTREAGRASFMVKGARGKKARVKANLFSPLNVLNVDYYAKPSGELLLVKEASLHTHYQQLPVDVVKTAMAIFLAEVLTHSLKESVGDHDLYDFLVHSFQYFDLMEQHTANFHIIFLVKLTRFLGIASEAGSSAYAAFVPLPVRDAINQNYEQACQQKMTREVRQRVLDELILYYSQHGFSMQTLRARAVLEEIFSG